MTQEKLSRIAKKMLARAGTLEDQAAGLRRDAENLLADSGKSANNLNRLKAELDARAETAVANHMQQANHTDQ